MWEYKLVGLSSIDREFQLNEYGARGWELIGFDGGVAHFKRPKLADSIRESEAPTAQQPRPKQRGK